MIHRLQIYKSDCVNPYKNLATEKYLLDNVANDSCILFLWQNKNTVVIGKNQNAWAECNCSLLEEEGAKLARRISGGGAVFHDLGNLNFTFLSSSENYDLNKNLEVIKKACSLAGISTEVSGRNDILADNRKFSGNAFYNTKDKSYHHGTILISADKQRMQRYLTPPKMKLEAKGIKSVQSRVVNLSELSPGLTCDAMANFLATAFELEYQIKPDFMEMPEEDKLLKLYNEFSSRDYIYGSSIPFSFSLEERFSWGYAELKFYIKNNLIQNFQMHTDSLDWSLSEKVKASLLNCRFDSESIKKVLFSSLPEIQAEDIFKIINKNLF